MGQFLLAAAAQFCLITGVGMGLCWLFAVDDVVRTLFAENRELTAGILILCFAFYALSYRIGWDARASRQRLRRLDDDRSH